MIILDVGSESIYEQPKFEQHKYNYTKIRKMKILVNSRVIFGHYLI